MIRPEDCAYAAGIIDGEGSISIHKKEKSRCFVLAVQVGVTDYELVDWLQFFFGGHINSYQPKGERKVVHIWRLFGTQAQEFIEQIKPYLILKKYKAELAISFRVGGSWDEHEILYEKYCSLRSTKANHLRGGYRL